VVVLDHPIHLAVELMEQVAVVLALFMIEIIYH